LKFGFHAKNCGTVIPVKLLITLLHESNACQVYVLHFAGIHSDVPTAAAKFLQYKSKLFWYRRLKVETFNALATELQSSAAWTT